MLARHAVALLHLVLGIVVAVTAGAGRVHAEEHKNVVELFLGGTTDEEETAFSLGLTYERRIIPSFGVGLLSEWVAGDAREVILGFPLFVHPYRGLRFLVAPGIDFETGEGSHEFLLRLGGAYEFEITEHWSIVPEVNGDFVDGDKLLVWGVSFGYGF